MTTGKSTGKSAAKSPGKSTAKSPAKSTGESTAKSTGNSTAKPSTSVDALADLRERLRLFAAERDWQQFHTPKNLAMSIAIEAAEIMEHFQWLTAAQGLDLDAVTRREVAHEIADVLLYLIRLADVLDIDLPAAAREKIGLNASKYPVRGSL